MKIETNKLFAMILKMPIGKKCGEIQRSTN